MLSSIQLLTYFDVEYVPHDEPHAGSELVASDCLLPVNSRTLQQELEAFPDRPQNFVDAASHATVNRKCNVVCTESRHSDIFITLLFDDPRIGTYNV